MQKQTFYGMQIIMVGMVMINIFSPAIFKADAQQLGFRGQTNPAWRENYDYDFDFSTETIYTVRHRGEEVIYFLVFSTGNSGSYDQRTLHHSEGAAAGLLEYQLYTADTKDVVLTDQGEISGFFPATGGQGGGFQTEVVSFFAHIPENQFPRAGEYQDLVDVSLLSGNPDNFPAEDVASFEVIVQVPMMIGIALVPSGAPYNNSSQAMVFDFGTLQQGFERTCDLMVQANVPYSVAVTSAEGGVMTPRNFDDDSFVPYVLTVSGEEIIMQAEEGTPIAMGGPTLYEGHRYPLVVTIGDFGMATEGSYEDLLTFTVVAE